MRSLGPQLMRLSQELAAISRDSHTQAPAVVMARVWTVIARLLEIERETVARLLEGLGR